MLYRRHDIQLPAGALDGQFTLLPRSSSEHVPDLPHGRAFNRNAVDGDEMIAGLDAIIPERDRGLSFEVRDAQDGEAAIVVGAEGHADDVKIRKVEHPA